MAKFIVVVEEEFGEGPDEVMDALYEAIETTNFSFSIGLLEEDNGNS